MQGMPSMGIPAGFSMQPSMQPAIPIPEPPLGELPNDREQLGEILYPLVESKAPRYAAKITGMLLEMDVKQIQNILMDHNQLDKWISEAMRVLNKGEPGINQ